MPVLPEARRYRAKRIEGRDGFGERQPPADVATRRSPVPPAGLDGWAPSSLCAAPSLLPTHALAVTFRRTASKAAQGLEFKDDQREGEQQEGQDAAPTASQAGPMGWLFLAALAVSVAGTFVGESRLHSAGLQRAGQGR